MDHVSPLPAGPKYEPIFELGRGGMATVYLAISRGLAGFNKLVVLKQLRQEIASDPEFLTMLLEEARIAARINHPNVIQTNDIGFDGNAHYIAMEYLEGQTLQEITLRAGEQGRRLPLRMYVHILCQVLRGLHSAHELTNYDGAPLSIVHRDMTPHNVFVTYEGVVKVLDFGIAKAADSKNETQSGTFKGKLRYIAPEQALGIPLDRRADIFAIGAMMWHALSNTRMWKGVGETEVLMQLAQGQIPSIAEAAPNAPLELRTICQQALAHRPAERFSTAAEMLDALESYLVETQSLVSQRELAQFVSELFEEQRSAVRAAIDRRVREGLSGNDIPLLSAGPVSMMTGSAQPPPSVPSLSGPRSVPFHARHHAEEARPSPFRRYTFAGAAALLAALFGFGVYQLATHDGASSAPPIASGASGASGASAGSIAPSSSTSAGGTPESPVSPASTCRLHVKVNPSTAIVRLDGAPFSGDGQVARDGASHRLEIEAPGFKSQSDYVVFDREALMLSYSLAKKEAPVWRGAARPAKPKDTGSARQAAEAPPVLSATAAIATATSTPSSVVAPSKKKPKATLDPADPWK